MYCIVVTTEVMHEDLLVFLQYFAYDWVVVAVLLSWVMNLGISDALVVENCISHVSSVL